MPIAELFLGALITTVFTRLTSPEMVNFACREGIESQLKKWSRMLVKIRAVLADAEHKQIRGADDSPDPINLWLQELRDLAYDVDDLLDEFACDALANSNTSPAHGKSGKVHQLVRCFGACNPCMVVSNARMESRLEVFTARFQYIMTQQDLLRLSHTPTGSVGSAGNTNDRGTSCVFDKSAIFGREEDKKSLIELLLQGRDQVGVGVIPIIGMGGLGKTTLAQLVYNDSTIEDYFPVRAWTCVSDEFNRERITRSILESLNISPKGTDLNSLQVHLREALSGKKFLIILDDVWNEDYHAWDSLYAPFSSGLSGSMIIVTTRNKGVASLVRNISPYRLRQLPDDVCKSIFLHHALGVARFEAHQNLVDIGTQIAKRCKGLPLAAKLLGGILRNEKRPDQWQNVLESEIWDLPKSGILPVLKLSYYHLPSHLKQCFAYCSLFPADYKFNKQDLILLWMAEGFLQPTSLGSDYFDDLMSRSFFQPSSRNSSTFLMHDLIHDLARHVASDAYLPVDNHNATSQDTTIRARHSSFVQGKFDTCKRLEAFGEINSLRTFLTIPTEKRFPSFLSRKVLLDLLLKLTRLRVLSLSGYRIKQLPDSVGQLKHLRYLNMTGTDIEKLPESVTSLFNLLALILRSCKNLKELPSSIGNLVDLEYLDLDRTPKLLQMPSAIINLTSLQKLSKFVVGQNEELGISALKRFPSLQGKLCILGIHNVVDISGAIHADLNSKEGLEDLGMEWKDEFDDSRNDEIERQVLDRLQPPKSVQKLDIVCYGGERLPFWTGDPLCAPNIVRLRIYGCKNLTSLPPLGRLPLLKELILGGLDGVTSVGDELYGYDDPHFMGKAFPSLRILHISDMLGWEEWSCSNGHYILHTLVLRNCPKLTGKLPSHLPSLRRVHIENCSQLRTAPVTTCSLASLRELHLDDCVIDNCSLQVHLSSLTRLRIVNMSDLCSLNMLNSLTCLHELSIERCPRLVSFGETSLPSTLKSLKLSDCEVLETLPLMHAECFLDTLSIQGCNSLEYFPVNELVWRVKNLSIDNNAKLSEDIMVRNIESLTVCNCLSLTCFPARGKTLPSSLKSLSITKCENLQTLTEGMLMQDDNMPLQLENISISQCPSLTCFPTNGKLPTSLKKLSIGTCSKLVAVRGTLPGASLESIGIYLCPKFRELPESLVQCNIPNLKGVSVLNCKRFKSLPNQINNLTRLDKLCVKGCPAVRWSNNPQGGGLGFPFSLTSLTIGRTPLLEKDMWKWGLDCLTSLQHLHIDGSCLDDMVSFPAYDDDKCSLPTSITALQIYCFKNLESLSNGLQRLSFLKYLTMSNCPKLRYLPSEGLPPTLGGLHIPGSPIMGERCKKDGGDYWPIIFPIPCAHVRK